MGFAFNPFTGTFDVKGAGGGGGSAFFAGEAPTYADLPLDGTAALDSRWLVRSNSGTWPFSSYKQAGVYVRIATVGSSRDNDYRLTDTSFHDVMSDAAFVIYDDGAPTRTMQVEITDNETLMFKVRGTDSVVRSVAFALSAIVIAALMASSALAQNIGLVTDTNGNIVSRRTNTLTFTNPVTWETNVVAATRTNLGLGSLATNNSVPSGAATTNSTLQADGAGGSAFVVSRTQTVAMTNSAFRTNTIDTSTNMAQAGMVVNLDANSTYHFAYAFIITSSTTGGFGATLRHSSTNGLRSTYVGRQGRPIGVSAIDITATSSGTISLQSVNFAATNIVTTGTGILATGTASGTLTLCWHQNTATNVASELVAGSMMTVTKISP
jgi:hypothetical protein